MRVEDPKTTSQPEVRQLCMICCIDGEVFLVGGGRQWCTDGDNFTGATALISAIWMGL